MYDSGTSNTIGGDNLNAAHARMLLLLSLAFTSDLPTIHSWFQSFGTGDVEISVDENTVLTTSIEEESVVEEPVVEVEVPTPSVEPTVEPSAEPTPEPESSAPVETTPVEEPVGVK
jgi:L-asparaginase